VGVPVGEKVVHTPEVHVPALQSEDPKHPLPMSHPGHGPPQSMSVSSSSCTPLTHPGDVGMGDGFGVGMGEGEYVGSSVVGSVVGVYVGNSVGRSVGCPVGVYVGDGVGYHVGLGLGARDGEEDGNGVGEEVGGGRMTTTAGVDVDDPAKLEAVHV